MTLLLFKRSSHYRDMPNEVLANHADNSNKACLSALFYTMLIGAMSSVLRLTSNQVEVPAPVTAIQNSINKGEYTPDVSLQWINSEGHLVHSTAREQQAIAQENLNTSRSQIQKLNVNNLQIHKASNIAFDSTALSLTLGIYFVASRIRLGLENRRRKNIKMAAGVPPHLLA